MEELRRLAREGCWREAVVFVDSQVPHYRNNLLPEGLVEGLRRSDAVRRLLVAEAITRGLSENAEYGANHKPSFKLVSRAIDALYQVNPSHLSSKELGRFKDVIDFFKRTRGWCAGERCEQLSHEIEVRLHKVKQ